MLKAAANFNRQRVQSVRPSVRSSLYRFFSAMQCALLARDCYKQPFLTDIMSVCDSACLLVRRSTVTMPYT